MAKRAPIQSRDESDPTSIPWAVHLKAWKAYDKKYPRCQSAERLAARGGFHVNELDEFYPGWREADAPEGE